VSQPLSLLGISPPVLHHGSAKGAGERSYRKLRVTTTRSHRQIRFEPERNSCPIRPTSKQTSDWSTVPEQRQPAKRQALQPPRIADLYNPGRRSCSFSEDLDFWTMQHFSDFWNKIAFPLIIPSGGLALVQLPVEARTASSTPNT
jgi:hypothetical protein